MSWREWIKNNTLGISFRTLWRTLPCPDNHSKILQACYNWLTILKDSYSYVRTCHPWQLLTGKPKLPNLPLHLMIVEGPFQQWGLDFTGEFKENSSNGHKRILICTNFFTKLVESIPTKQSIDKVVKNFPEERRLTRFRCPLSIVVDNSKAVSYLNMSKFCMKHGIILRHS